MDQLTNMQVFAQVVETESFTAAANRLGLSRAAVSKRIQRLEADLGTRLLNRTTRRVSPTEIGRAYYQRCAKVLEEAENAEAFVRELHNRPTGTLRINAPQSFGNLHLGPALAEFAARYPNLAVNVTLNDRVVSLFEENYDIALRIARSIAPTLIGHRLSPVRLALVASPGYLDRRGRPAAPADLKPHDWLHYAYAATGATVTLHGPNGVHSLATESSFTANSGDLLCDAAIAGRGVAMLPTFIAWSALADGRLEVVLPDYAPPPLTLFAVHAPDARPTAKVRLLIEFLDERFGPAPYWDGAFPAPPPASAAAAPGRR